MSITHTHKLTVSSSGIAISDTTEAVTGDTEIGFDGSIPGSATTEIDVAFPLAAIKSIIILASAALTLKTNSSGAPAQTIALAAGVPFVWKNTDGTINPITVDVTKLFLVNALVPAATLKVRVLLDGTP